MHIPELHNTGQTTTRHDTCLTAIFQDNPDKLVPECLHSGF